MITILKKNKGYIDDIYLGRNQASFGTLVKLNGNVCSNSWLKSRDEYFPIDEAYMCRFKLHILFRAGTYLHITF